MMTCHSSKAAGDILQLQNLHHLRSVVFERGAAFAPNTLESEAGLGMDFGRGGRGSKRKHKDDAIADADAHLERGKVAAEGAKEPIEEPCAAAKEK